MFGYLNYLYEFFILLMSLKKTCKFSKNLKTSRIYSWRQKIIPTPLSVSHNWSDIKILCRACCFVFYN